MTTGIIIVLGESPGDPPRTQGRVQVDETNEIFSFRDPNFASTGLGLNDPCSFDIVDDPITIGGLYATHLGKITLSQPNPITGPYTGNIVAKAGDTILITGAATVVSGDIQINGGKVIVEQNASVSATTIHAVSGGTLVARKGGLIKGGINIDGGGSLKVVNKGKIVGGINVQSGGRLIVGNENGPGTIIGNIDIQKIRKVGVTADSRINCTSGSTDPSAGIA